MGGSVDLDALDRRILDLLADDGRMPFTTMAKRLHVAEATVRKRVAHLQREEVVRVVGLVEPAYTGTPVKAVVGVQTEGQDVDEIVKTLLQAQEVRYVAVCAGTYDIMLEVAVASNEELFTFLTKNLRMIPGVVGSDTSMVMKVYKDRYLGNRSRSQESHTIP